MNALAKPLVHNDQTYAELDVDDISPSPLNHRKIFRGIEELGESIKDKGLRVPIKVRPTPDGETPYQLVYGERRWRGAKHAGVKKLPALIRNLTDVEVLEEQLVENVSREDVHPLEESDGYKQLIDKHGYDVDALAAKTGKSKAYIYARLKLCEITGGVARVAFGEDKINASIALLIARIPNPKLQDRATREILEGPDGDDSQLVHGEWIKVKRPMSYREAQIHLQQNYMLRLENAPFPITDDKLVKGVGSCVGCLFRTGNQRELFDDVKSADVCTNPPCFAKKRDAQSDREVVAWIKAGKKVLNKAEAEKLFEQRGVGGEYFLPWNCAYADAEEAVPYEIDRKHRSWAELFGGKDNIPLVFARDPAGEQWQLIHRASALKVLQKSGVLKEKKESTSTAGSTPRVRSGSAKLRELDGEELLLQKTTLGAAEEILKKALPLIHGNSTAAWKWLATEIGRLIDYGEGAETLSRLYEFESWHKVSDQILAKAKTVSDYQEFVIAAMACDRICGDGSPSKPLEGAVDAFKVFGIDAKKIKADAELATKTALEAAAAAKAAKKTKKKAKAKKGRK